jgi:hypothetical protein
MSSGHVIAGSTVKIVDHGPDSARWNMVILPEGYTASELGKFHDDAQRFVEHLYATAPFTDLWCGVNIHRLDVVSTSSGADYPATCPDDQPGDGVPTSITVDTFFDASFCRSSTRRLLSCARRPSRTACSGGASCSRTRGGRSRNRVALPALPGDPDGTRAGTWQIVLRLIDRRQVDKRLLNVVGRRGEGGLPFSALVHCYSNLVFDARLSQNTTEPGGEATIRATPREYDVPLGGEPASGPRSPIRPAPRRPSRWARWARAASKVALRRTSPVSTARGCARAAATPTATASRASSP